MKKLYSLFLCLSILLIPGLINAQFTRTDVSAIVANPSSFNQGVYVQGKYTVISGQEDWTFEGINGGTIRSDVDDDAGTPQVNQVISAFGYMDQDNGVWEIDVQGWYAGTTPPINQGDIVSWNSVNSNPSQGQKAVYQGTVTGAGSSGGLYAFNDGSNPNAEISIQNNLLVPSNGTEILCFVTINTFFNTFHNVAVWTSSVFSSLQDLREIGINVFPNPTSDFIMIESNKPNLSAMVRDEAGKIAIDEVLTGEKLDISKLPAGIYFLSIYDSEKIFGNTKIVKE